VAFRVRFYSGLPLFVEVTPSLAMHVRYVVLLIPVWLALFAVMGLYTENNLLGGTREYALVFNACTLGTMLAIAATFFSQRIILSRGWLLLAWLCGLVCVSVARFSLRRVIYWLRRRGRFLAPAVIVGAGGEGVALARQLQTWDTSGLRLVGFIDDSQPPGTPVLNGLTVLGGVANVPHLVEKHGIREVIVASSSVPRESLLELVGIYALSDHMRIRLSSGLFEILTTGVSIKEVGYVPLICLNKVRLQGIEIAMKTALDYAITLPGLLLLSPVLAAIAVAIKLDSPGPVLYRRRVVGKGGRPFDGLKFRSMRADGDAILAAQPELEEELAHNHKLEHDPRITRVGAFLRRWSLDELPQLWNVLRRQMSLVGPRMIAPEELEKYGKWDMNLLTVWPGLTGLWQISGRSDVTYDERVQLDMYYIRNYTIWLDLQILIETVPAVIKGRGAR
jgi:exopolysaccharide biosynthesis polyprenyl glycosylphosphotransferase